MALTSSSTCQEVELILNHFGVRSLFEVVITGDGIIKGKPDPEPYLTTLHKINEKSKNCLVIEDTKSGVLSAKAAGLKCLAITTTHDKEDLHEADCVVDKFSEIKENLIRSL